MEQDPLPTGPKEPPPTNPFLRYSSFAFQLLGGIGLAAWAGHSLDQYLKLKFPAFLLFFVFAVFGGMMYQVYKKFNQE